jgi:hypothetical protein
VARGGAGGGTSGYEAGQLPLVVSGGLVGGIRLAPDLGDDVGVFFGGQESCEGGVEMLVGDA